MNTLTAAHLEMTDVKQPVGASKAVNTRSSPRPRAGMYIPPWPGLTLDDVVGPARGRNLPYPFCAERQHAFCVARSGIYHLFRSLRFQPGEVVLMPDYHSGNEVAAVRAAGAEIIFYPIGADLQPDLQKLSELASKRPRLIYIIHYLGWPQPLNEIMELCRRSGAMLFEDCALSLLSESEGRPLGASGDYSVFCVYKTLPVPNGGLLVQNNPSSPEISNLNMEPCPPMTSIGRTAELAFESIRSRWSRVGRTLFDLKQAAGNRLRAADVRNVPVGDIGWNPANVNIGMSPLGNRVIRRTDHQDVVRKRRENFLELRNRLHSKVMMLREDLEKGVCPLFFPILVRNKHEIAVSLRERGIQAVEFWNDATNEPIGPAARYLRKHVLELPIHQGVTSAQLNYIADTVERLRPEPAPDYV